MSQYRSVYADPNGPDDARPTALQIIKDLGLSNKLSDKICVVTGGHAGIGLETTRALLETGMTLYLTARNVSAAQAALAPLGHSAQLHVVHMDNSSFDSVRKGANELLMSTDKIHMLINNAGIMAIPSLELTGDGHESQFQTNHLSHFLLFELLKPALLHAATASFAARVVNVSASAHRLHGLNSNSDYAFQRPDCEYDPWHAYAQSKTANIYMASAITRTYSSRNLIALSLHPGIIPNTSLPQHVPEERAAAIRNMPFVKKVAMSISQGAATTVWAALSSEAEGLAGRYLINCCETEKGVDDKDITALGTCSWTYDVEGEERLWKESEKMVGLVASG